MKRGIRLVSKDEDVIENMERAMGTRQMMETFCRLGEALSEDNPVSFGKRSNADDEWSPVEYFREMFNDY